MKKILLSLLLLLAGLTAQAQTTLVATLIDTEGNVEGTFYGADALKDAHTSASHGYTIVLSPGQFNAGFTFNKLITIRGAGMTDVPEKSIHSTVLNGIPTFSYSPSLPEYSSTSYRLKLEGVCIRERINFANNCGLKDAQFLKCCISDMSYFSANIGWTNVSFVDCYILGHINIPNNSSVAFYNSVIKLISSKTQSSTVFMMNCVAKLNGGDGWTPGIVQGQLCNSFLLNGMLDYYPPASVDCQNCYSTNSDMFVNQTGQSNTALSVGINTIFANFDGTNWTDTYDFYKLTTGAAGTLLGGDGKQMGIYGGLVPFSPLTSAPQVTKFEAPESTTNGILPVSIKVEMPQ